MPGRFCPSCGTELSAQARFCHRCGQPAGGTPAPAPRAGERSERTAWLVAGGIVALLLAMIGWRMFAGIEPPPPPAMGNAGNVAPGGGATDPGGDLPTAPAPDISNLSPEERFLRLNNRVMEAAGRQDSATVINFTPMALGAYAQLPDPTLDDRYHAAVLNAQVGRFAEALSLADTILAAAPGHLLAFVVRGDVAELQGDAARQRQAFADFLAAWDAEIGARRVEYADHRNVLDDFRQRASTTAP